MPFSISQRVIPSWTGSTLSYGSHSQPQSKTMYGVGSNQSTSLFVIQFVRNLYLVLFKLFTCIPFTISTLLRLTITRNDIRIHSISFFYTVRVRQSPKTRETQEVIQRKLIE